LFQFSSAITLISDGSEDEKQLFSVCNGKSLGFYEFVDTWMRDQPLKRKVCDAEHKPLNCYYTGNVRTMNLIDIHAMMGRLLLHRDLSENLVEMRINSSYGSFV